MATQLILKGIVQGVFCRNYCSTYGKRLRISGSASNLPDGNVRVILNTDDENRIKEYVDKLRENPLGIRFFGRIDSIDISPYTGPVRGDYTF